MFIKKLRPGKHDWKTCKKLQTINWIAWNTKLPSPHMQKNAGFQNDIKGG